MHSAVGLDISLQVLSDNRIQKLVLSAAATNPPCINAFSTVISLILGIVVSMVTPSEQTGSDASNARLYATTVK